MSILKKFGLIIKNCKYSIYEVKSQISNWQNAIWDKMSQRVATNKSEYEDLSPEKEIKNGEEYLSALFWGIKNNNVKNIALTGPYGSGKSSVIQSYLKKYPSTKALSVSLATFNQNGDVNEEKDVEKAIELGILKQLFYKVDSKVLPQSRYRKIKKVNLKNVFVRICGSVVLGVEFVAFFLPENFEKYLSMIRKAGEYRGIGESISYFITFLFMIVGIGIVSYALIWCANRFRVKEVTIADSATVSGDKDESSIFDKAMDELVYFFEATDYNVVFIEDLDRFKSTKIFVKLRELNTILNNYDLIKRKIVFVYAIRDDMFECKDRTKFFDFIVPIIPIITTTNSGEILREKLKVEKQQDGTTRSTLYKISASYINLISPFIEDMRVLTNICNEFIVYKNTLQSVNLNDEEMFSMMLFKCLYPKEFSELEAEKGIVIQAFREKEEFIKAKSQELDTEIKELEKILDGIKGDILKSVREVKAALLDYLAADYGPFQKCYIESRYFQYREIMEDDFDMSRFMKENSISVVTYNGNNRSVDIKQIKDYLERIEYLKNNENQRKYEIRNKIEDCRNSVAMLHTYSLKRLLEIYDKKKVFSKDVLENQVLVFLLRNGFINENYGDYINYFHPNSITKDEMNYIRGIRMQEAVGHFSYPITKANVEEVCERIEDYEFSQFEALNFDVLDYLITCRAGSDKCEKFFCGLITEWEQRKGFIDEYIQRNENIELFVNLLCNRYPAFWNGILNDETFTKEKKFEYLVLILKYADLDDIVTQDNNSEKEVIWESAEEDETDIIADAPRGITVFIEENENSLIALSNVPVEKMIQVIKKLGLRFQKIDSRGIDIELLEYIFNHNYYELKYDMLKLLCIQFFPNKLVEFERQNYTCIRSCNYKPLINRLGEDGSFKEYVNEMFVKRKESKEESIEAIKDIIERLFDKDFELCKEVIKLQNILWEDISDFCKCCRDDQKKHKKQLWDYVLQNDYIRAKWGNFIGYYDEFGLTEELITWLDGRMEIFVQEDRLEELTDELVVKIIKSDISLEAFRMITDAYSLNVFECKLEEFTREEIIILIENRYVLFSVSRLEELDQLVPDLIGYYLSVNRDDFMKDINGVNLRIEAVIELLKKDCFTEEEKIRILKLASVTDMNHELALEVRNFKQLIMKEYVEAAWEILEEKDRYQLFLYQLENFTLQEISMKLGCLDDVYRNLSDNQKKHKEYLPFDEFGYNKLLLDKLVAKDYLSSAKIDEYEKEDVITHKKQKVKRFEVWVKNQSN